MDILRHFGANLQYISLLNFYLKKKASLEKSNFEAIFPNLLVT